MNVRRSLLVLVPASCAAALLTSLGPAVAHPADPGRTTIASTAPTGTAARALAQGSTTAAPSAVVRFQVQLRLRDQAGAERLATAVSTPGSSAYGHYLSPASFNARFAPTQSQASSVTRFLSSYGITVTSTAANRRWIQARGTGDQVGRAFGVQMRSYRMGSDVRLTDDRAVSVPNSLASTILTVTGLNETGGAKPGLLGKDPASTSPGATRPAQDHLKTPCSSSWGARHAKLPSAYGTSSFPTSICGYTPAQLQAAYGMQGAIAGGRNGKGVSVAIIDAYSLPTMEADADRYFAHYGEAGFAAGQYQEILPRHYRLQGPCGEASWQTEQVLDVESVHGLAPGADVTYVAGKQLQLPGPADAAQHDRQRTPGRHREQLLGSVQRGVGAHLMAERLSRGAGAGGRGRDRPVLLRPRQRRHLGSVRLGGARLPRIGPDGDRDRGNLARVGLHGCLPVRDRMGQRPGGSRVRLVRHRPIGYNPAPPGTFYAGTGGGVSTLFKQPAYQKDAVPANLSHMYGGPARRVEPDLSADADPYTGYRLGYTDPASGAWTRVTYGGTSLATPLVAAMVADASQHRATPVGFFNPLLYSIAVTRAARRAAYADPGRHRVHVDQPRIPVLHLLPHHGGPRHQPHNGVRIRRRDRAGHAQWPGVPQGGARRRVSGGA